MSTPSDVLHAALSAQPQQTAGELVDALARSGHHGLGVVEVGQLLHRDPRLRNDGGTPPRWRALGTGQPAPLANVPAPHHPAMPVLAPAASFGDRAPVRAPEPAATPGGILPASAFGGRPPVRLPGHPAAAPTPEAAMVTPPVARPVRTLPALPVRVPVLARALAPVEPADAMPAAPVSAPPVWVPKGAAPAPTWVPHTLPVSTASVSVPVVAAPVVARPAATPPVVAAPARPLAQRVPRPAPVPAPVDVPVTDPEPPVSEPTIAVAKGELVATPEAVVVEATHHAFVVDDPATPVETTPSAAVSPASPAVVEETGTDRGPLAPGGEVRYVGPQLRRWQKDVLDAWLSTDRRGIVEAVSAQGRATVGVLATWDALTRGEKVLVLVPTTDLMEQWFSTFEIQLPGLSLGRRGDGWTHTFDDCDVLVSLVSAAFGQDLLQHGAGLLVADAVHKYGTARPAETLRREFGARLGLTSSVERLDAGVDEILLPYFGTVLDGCELRRGRKEGVLARFRLAFVPVDLDAAEQAEHDALSAQIDQLAARLAQVHGCRAGAFVDDVKGLQGRWQENSAAAADASAYLRAVSTRRDLLATSSAKLDALALLAPTVARSTHSVVFTHTKDDAESAATRLRTAGVATDVVHHGLETRRSSLRSFRDGSLRALTAPKVLDEGLDLPPVDVVVVLAGSRSTRQSVQRMSPILHPTQATRLPAGIVVYARGTIEDPARGTGEGHLEELVEVATEVRTFDVGSSGAAIAAWFVGA